MLSQTSRVSPFAHSDISICTHRLVEPEYLFYTLYSLSTPSLFPLYPLCFLSISRIPCIPYEAKGVFTASANGDMRVLE